MRGALFAGAEPQMIQPHRQMFAVEAGMMFKRAHGSLRECFFIAIPGSRGHFAEQLAEYFGQDVVLARNEKLGMDYMVSNRPNGKFTSGDLETVQALWSFHIRDLPNEQ
jgi:hypothetical protein